jgi:tyrosyl-tRNA synthetase
MDKWEGSQLNKAKEILAYELTNMVHGEEEAQKALDAAKALFAKGGASANVPTVEIEVDGEIGILDILVATKQCSSRGDARRNVDQGGVSVNDEKITEPKAIIPITDEVIIKKGKKSFHKVILK